MTWPIRTSRAVTALSPELESLLSGGAPEPGGAPAPGVPPLRGTFKAELLAAYERRGGAPCSTWRLFLREVRWPVASLSAAAAACVVIFAGALSNGMPWAGDRSGGESPSPRMPSSSASAASSSPSWTAALPSARTGASTVARAPAAGRGPDVARGGAVSRALSPTRPGERELAFVGGEWEHVHPLPSSVAKVRVVDDQNLPLIGVGWAPDLDGP